MKRKTAKEILAESFRELADHIPIDKITIKEITENCGYSTATFYRQFRDKYDLIAWDYTRELEANMSQFNGDMTTWKKVLLDAAHFFDGQKEYLANLFLHTSGLDSFITYMREINYNTLRKTIRKISGGTAPDEKTEMYIRIYVLGTVQLTCEWILEGHRRADPEMLAEVYEHSLPEPLKQYLK